MFISGSLLLRQLANDDRRDASGAEHKEVSLTLHNFESTQY